jgi:hypothetical protein
MSIELKAIVENGYQILQSPGGERINYLTSTKIIQDTNKVADCVFSLYVNNIGNKEKPSCKYDPFSEHLITPSGERLFVHVLTFSPRDTEKQACDEITAKCTVIFPYETRHPYPGLTPPELSLSAPIRITNN